MPALGHSDDVYTLAADPVRSGIWLGFFQSGLALLVDGRIVESHSAADGLGKGMVSALRFDRDGALASRGQPREALLKALLDDAYFRRAPPKSTGRDRFNLDWLRSFGVTRYKTEDVQATLAELSARSIARAISKFCPGAAEVYLCGGGARNRDLVKRIARALPEVPVATTARLGIHADWVEAMAFAWLAKRRLECATGNLSSVTGARGPRVLGAVYAG